ncbi:Amyloid protein-binding protein 2 [Mactra antiquata]
MDENWTSSNEDLLNQLYPAHRACRDGDIEKLASLLSTGEVNLYEEDDFYGWTPIHWAAYFGKLQCLTYILEQGGSCDAATERLNQTPSHIAAYGGHCQCLKWLLNCGGTMNRQDYMGETPIHKAARTGSMECVSLLVSQGANLSLKNYSGNTASQVAMSAGYVDCANYIERAAQLQCQTLGIPATPATNNGNTSVNFGRTSPEGQPSVQNNFISTNTYHSHPHITMNGTSHHPSIQNGLNNNNHDDCDMEMAEESHDSGINQSNCSNGYHGDVQTGDILLNQGVSKNVVPLAGKKRGREDTEEETFKRARQDGLLNNAVSSSDNNNILSSYFAVLAISTEPLRVDTIHQPLGE